MKMTRDTFLKKIADTLELIQNAGGIILTNDVSEPAKIEDVKALESAYQLSFPNDFVYFLTDIAAEVDVQWHFEAYSREWSMSPFSISSGHLEWSIKKLVTDVEYFKSYNPKGLILHENGIITPENALDGTMAIFEVPCGDEIRMNLAAPTQDKPIFYLSHDDVDQIGIQLAPNFEHFVTHLLDLAFVGSELEKYLPFISEECQGLDSKCRNAMRWMEYLQEP